MLYRLPDELEWVESSFGDPFTNTEFGQYIIRTAFLMDGVKHYLCGTALIDDMNTYRLDSRDEAKAKVLEIYRDRLSSCLIPATASDVTSWLESDYANAVECLEVSKFLHSRDQEFPHPSQPTNKEQSR